MSCRPRLSWLVGCAGSAPLLGVAVACAAGPTDGTGSTPAPDVHEQRRRAMVATQIEARGVHELRVLAALARVPRHRFVPPELVEEAYADRPLPIGEGQTISQPYIVGLMSELAGLTESSRVLEIGTGCGYQAAVLAELAAEVYTIEILDELAVGAAARLAQLGYRNIHVRSGDGFDGWPERAPFDAIVVTASPTRIPQPLLEQLAPGGRLVIPLGEQSQELVVVTRTSAGYDRRSVIPVRFVPMTGKARNGD